MMSKEIMQSNSIYRYLFLSMAISIIIQVVGIACIKDLGNYDSKEYLSISESLFKGKGYSIEGVSFKGFEAFKGESPTRMRQPGYPFYLVLFYWAVGQKLLITQISQIILNTLTIYIVFLIARMTFGHNLWKGTLIGLGLYFPLWLTSVFIGTETLFTFLLAIFMYTFLKAIRSSNPAYRIFALAGFLLGLVTLTRPSGLPIAFICFIPIIMHIRRFRKSLLLWGVFISAFFITLLPWSLRNAIVFGEFTFLSTEGGYNNWVSTQNEGKSVWLDSLEFQHAVQDGYYLDKNADHRFRAMALEHIKDDPVSYFIKRTKIIGWVWSYFAGSQNYKNNSLIFAVSTVTQFIILLCCSFVLFINGRKTASYYLLPAVSISCILLFTDVKSRLIVPAMPFILILSGQGFWILINRIVFLKNKDIIW